jgi:hypothetical protein
MPPIAIMSDSSSESDEQWQAFLLQIAGMAIVVAVAAAVVYVMTKLHTILLLYLVRIGCESSLMAILNASAVNLVFTNIFFMHSLPTSKI